MEMNKSIKKEKNCPHCLRVMKNPETPLCETCQLIPKCNYCDVMLDPESKVIMVGEDGLCRRCYDMGDTMKNLCFLCNTKFLNSRGRWWANGNTCPDCVIKISNKLKQQ